MRIHGGQIGIKRSYDLDYQYKDYVKLRGAGLGLLSLASLRLAIAKLNKRKP